MTRASLNQSISTLGWPRWALDLVSAPLAWVAAMLVVVFTNLTH